MSIDELLRHANDNKPADFTKEFKSQIDIIVQKAIQPEVVEEDDNEDNNKKDKEGEEE